jgi:hypothetical protein
MRKYKHVFRKAKDKLMDNALKLFYSFLFFCKPDKQVQS